MIQLRFLILILIFQFDLSLGESREVAFPQCPVNDPQLNSCLNTVFNNFYRYVKEVKKTPSLFRLEVVHVNDLPFDFNLQGIQIKGRFSNCSYRGLEKHKVLAVKNNIKKLRIDLKVFVPDLILSGNYVMTGQIPLLPLSGVGTFQVLIDSANIILKIYAHRVFKQGVPHLQVSKIETDFNVKHLKFSLTESRSKLLENIYNQIFNDNAQEFFKLFKPIIVTTTEESWKKYFDSNFSVVPEHEFLSY